MNYDAIRSLLDAQLDTVSNLPTHQTENTRITPGESWVRSTLLPAEPNPVTIGPTSTDEHQGLYQVDICFPQDRGTTDTNSIAAAVMTAFKRGMIFTDGTVNVHIRMVWQQTGYQVNSSYVAPVIIRWVSYA